MEGESKGCFNKNTEVKIDLCVKGEDININDLSLAFGFLPTDSSNDNRIIYDCKYWDYDMGSIKSSDAGLQLSMFIDKFRNRIPQLKELCSKFHNSYMSLNVNIKIRDKEPLIFVSRENIKALAELNCILYFNIYDFRCVENFHDRIAVGSFLETRDNHKELHIVSEYYNEVSCNDSIESLLAKLYSHKDFVMEKAKSRLVLNIDVTGGQPLVLSINRTYLKILNLIKADVKFNVKYLAN